MTPALQMTRVMVARGMLCVRSPAQMDLEGCREPQWWVLTGITGKSKSPSCSALLSTSLKDLVKKYTFSSGKRLLLIAGTHLGIFLLISMNFILRESSQIPQAQGRNALKEGICNETSSPGPCL